MNSRRTPFSLLAAMVVLLAPVGEATAAEGLRVSGDGGMLLRGQPFRGYGVNYFDAFNRTLGPTSRTTYDAGFAELAKRKIPFARFGANDRAHQLDALQEVNRRWRK